MVYLDSSVALAYLGAEDRSPPPDFWKEQLISSRLLAYETFSRLSTQGRMGTHGVNAREILRRVSLLDMVEPVIGRATEGFSVPLRTLDALHLATMVFLSEQGVDVTLASYDRRFREAARATGFGLYPL